MKHKKVVKLKESKETPIQQTSTKSTSVGIADFKKRNALNKYKSRRSFIAKPNNAVKIGRNEPCHCGSGVKFKNCHLVKQIIKKQ